MAYTNRPFNYEGNLPNQVEHDLELANDNFEILGQAFVNNTPTTATAKNSDKVDGYHASQTPQANTIPVAGPTGKLDAGWLPAVGNFNKVEFTTSGSWVVPSGVSRIIIFACAGGGGGSGNSSSSRNGGGGGGSGACVINFLCDVISGETINVTIGSGGSGGVGASNGGNGGDTIIWGSISGELVRLEGGKGGITTSDNFGIGGNGGFTFTITINDETYIIGDGVGGILGNVFLNGAQGGNGGIYIFNLPRRGDPGKKFFGRFNGGNGGNAVGNNCGGGGGGASWWGPGGNGGNGGSHGGNAMYYGAGGGGSGGGYGIGNRNGGAGGSGFVRIIYFA
jgi:hypothetical protein